MIIPSERTAPRIAFVDIETAPLIIAAWQTYETNAIWVERDTYILSFAVLWHGERKVKSYTLPDFRKTFDSDPHDDSALVAELFVTLDNADIVIAHNGERFDIPKINARLAVHGFKPPSPYKSFDTLKLARKFKFDSSKLDNLGRYLGCGRKLVTTGADLWRRCTSDKYDRRAWRRMRRYNEMDVRLLQRVYLKLRPWAQNHPDLRLYTTGNHCPTCLSKHIKQRGLSYGKSVVRQRWLCFECGHSFSGDIIHSQAKRKVSAIKKARTMPSEHQKPPRGQR